MSNTEIFIREHIIQLIAQELTFEQFEQWFLSEASNAEDDIVYEIKLLFAEYEHGDWTIEQMTEHLRDILEQPSI